MDKLKNKKYTNYDYISRYAVVPSYYHETDDKEFCGLGFNLKKESSYVLHTVLPGDTLDKLALTYYNNPTFWWIIAYFNDIQDAFINLRDYFEKIKIPQINSIEFGDLR